jgi:1-acyl-sn-glycerol-3-phosphate acyltransferase
MTQPARPVIQSACHRAANRVVALFMRGLFGYSARIHVLRRENAERSGGFLLASNHISHFDPFILSGLIRRKIDWMTMAEFFPKPLLGQFLRAVDAFPADRYRANRETIRATITRLRQGRIVGIFPEGGIRDGENSILHGAAAKSGVSVLAHMAGVPVVPCVILGSDRLYNARRWRPIKRTPVWIAFGDAILPPAHLEKVEARERIEKDFARALSNLSSELREKFSLLSDDLPQSPRQRMSEP